MSVMSMTISSGMRPGWCAPRRCRPPGRQAAALDHGLRLALEAQRHRHGDTPGRGRPEGSRRGDRAAHRVALHVLDDGGVGRAVDRSRARCSSRPSPTGRSGGSRRATETGIGDMPWPYTTPGMCSLTTHATGVGAASGATGFGDENGGHVRSTSMNRLRAAGHAQRSPRPVPPVRPARSGSSGGCRTASLLVDRPDGSTGCAKRWSNCRRQLLDVLGADGHPRRPSTPTRRPA